MCALRDAGVFWYHPHVREDIQQVMGLYGNIVVRAPRAATAVEPGRSTVSRPSYSATCWWATRGSSHSGAMPRRGRPDRSVRQRVPGERSPTIHALLAGGMIRFALTNASATRTYDVSFSGSAGGARMKLVGGDAGPVRARGLGAECRDRAG